MTFRTAALLLSLASITGLALAHGNEDHKLAGPVKMEQKPWGIAGEAKAVSRTIEIGMTDAMRFTPDRLEVRQGETIRFVHRNAGQVMHEFVLGTQKDLDEHAALMKKFPGMEHDEPYMSHVAPGQRGEIVWRFNRAGEFDFACLLPGHYEAGMFGKIKVVAQ
ncbi:cupredoxin family protein [Hydrogenophaga sp. YM1]|uniref:cupredoxin domain-containing protein n=1 Tax=Hydrogenophaga sp. YM1 TaxID=2806262 RepID=UPI00195707D0|nr:cupredoxin family protein [Hydrogenophaga sp. YM1]QRR32409.1 cupredoxin family protein [Hydrogenophaga sp. YM1]